MRIYFDTCSLNRPLDQRSQIRVAFEAEAVLGILALCEMGTETLVSSEILVLENARNPQPNRRAFVAAILESATDVVMVSNEIGLRAKALETRGFGAFDALHLACAEAGGVDYLCTCDDRLFKKARAQADLTVKVVSPLELANEVSL
jgi:predicted nucleic acid-binding protein